MPPAIEPTHVAGGTPDIAGGTPIPFADWQRVQWRLLWCWDTPLVAHTPAEGRMWRENRQIAFWWLVRGSVRLTLADGRRQTIAAGHALLQPSLRHQEAFSADAALVSIRVEARWPGGRPLRAAGPAVVLDADASAALLPLSRRLAAVANRAFDIPAGAKPSYDAGRAPLADLVAVQAAFWPWFAALTAAVTAAGQPWLTPGCGDARADALLALIDGWDLRMPLDADACARAAGLSAAGTRRLALRVLGATPRELLERRRLAEAEDLLRWAGLPQRELAARLGFSQAGHFGQWFRRRTCLTPEAWRRQGGGA